MQRFYFTVLLPCIATLAFTNWVFGDGNISIQLNNGNLTVTGQNNTDQMLLVVSGINPGDIVFYTDGLTTVNGQDVFLATGFNGDFHMDMRSGENIIVFSEQDEHYLHFHGDVVIETYGDAPAILLLDSVWVEGETMISTRNGDDALIINDSHFRDGLQISTGQGNDAMLIGWQNSINEFLNVSTNGGDDYVIVYNTELTGYFNISNGGGNDMAGLYNSYFWGGVVNGDSGADTLGRSGNFGRYRLLRLSIEESYDSGVWAMFSHAFSTNPSFWYALYLHNFFNLNN